MNLSPRALLLSAATVLAALPTLASAQEDLQTSSPLSSARVVESRVNTYTYNRQQDQALAVDAEGRILVAWGSRRQEHGNFGIFAQLLDPLGRPLGTEIHVNAWLPGNQFDPAVAFSPDGSAWVAWCSAPGQDGSLGGIYMRRLVPQPASDGRPGTLAPAGDEILVNELTVGDQANPTLAVNPDGTILAAWESAVDGRRRVRARLFDPDGSPRGGEFALAEAAPGRPALALGAGATLEEALSGAAGHQDAMPTLAVLDGGRFLAAWARTGPDGRPAGLFARILDASGKPGSDVLRLDPDDGTQAVEPSLDAAADGCFVVAWMRSEDGGDWQPAARRFDRDGRPVGGLLLPPAAGEGYRNGATVAVAPDGRFLVAWNEHRAKRAREVARRPVREVDVYGQVFDAEGQALGAVRRLNAFADGEQTLQVGLNSRHAAWTAMDQVLLAWHGRIGEDAREVALTLYAPEDLQVPAPPAVEPKVALDDATARELLAQQKEQAAPPDWDPNWVDDSYLPNPPPAGPDFGFTAFSATGWVPPDPDLAVGPNHIVAVVNVDMKFFDKQGNVLFSTPLESFWGTNGFVFDPVALYDEMAGRYVIAAAEHNGNTDYFDFAVSDDNDPNGTWYKYRFNVDSICGFIDFPNLGVDKDAYYVVADCFSGGGNFIHVIDKADVLNGSSTTITSINTSGSVISNGATRVYDTTAPAYYTISTFAAGSPNVKIFAVTNPTTSPQLHSVNVFVGAYSNPPDAEQLGTSNRADTIDYRIKNGVVRNGFLYAVHNVDGGDGAAKVRWYKIDLRGWPASGQNPVKVDSGYVDPGTNIDTWFGDVNVDASGNMAIAYNRSSPNEYIGVYRTFRLAGDPPGTVRTGVEMQTSTSPETGSRWGDYSGLEEDPALPGTFWNHHEYRTSSWRTWVGHFSVDPQLVLSQSPLFRGTTATFICDGADPNETVYFLYSTTGQGSGSCPPQLGGLCLDILDPVTITGSATANSNGTATLFVTVPSGAPVGLTVWSQAVVRRGAGGVDSKKSNVTSEVIQ